MILFYKRVLQQNFKMEPPIVVVLENIIIFTAGKKKKQTLSATRVGPVKVELGS